MTDSDLEVTPAEDLIAEIADQFSVYIGRGIRLDSVLEDVDPDLNINSLEDLLDIHFLLSGKRFSTETEQRPPNPTDGDDIKVDGLEIGVKDFISLLERRIRRLKTTTHQQTENFHGEVRGHIDWQETIKDRYRKGNPNSLNFACDITEENIAIDENKVLITLIDTLDKIRKKVHDQLDQPGTTEWFSDWTDDSPLVSYIKSAQSNIYLRELDSDDYTITTRMLQRVKKSRKPLYWEAAILLERYQQLQDGDFGDDQNERRQRAKELLSHEFVRPDQDEDATLFELYWIFRLLEAYDNPELQMITASTDLVAVWSDNEHRYELYHDWTGGDELRFEPPETDLGEVESIGEPDGYLRRYGRFLQTSRKESHRIFDHTRPKPPQARRPDFVLLRRDDTHQDASISHIALGEVKYSLDPSYVANGVEELLEYMIYARYDKSVVPAGRDSEYFTSGDDHYHTPSVTGFLCIDQVPYNSPADTDINILQTGDSISRPF